jgi:phosphate transport system substrate-binding protein
VTAGALLIVPAAAEARPDANAAAAKITISGSTSIYPLAVKLAKKYVKSHSVKFSISQGGSDTGIDDASHGRVTIGATSREPTSTDPKGMTYTAFARDAVCIVVNKKNKLRSISRQQIQRIFAGRLTNWSDVSGSKVSGPIQLFVRTPASGTQDAFQNIFMGQDLRIASKAKQKKSNGVVQQSVASNQRAIGYVSLDFTKGVKALAFAGVKCTLRNAKSGQYGGTRRFLWVSRGKPSGAAKTFINWTRTSKDAKKIIGTNWVVPK